jgi:hypothetical protein
MGPVDELNDRPGVEERIEMDDKLLAEDICMAAGVLLSVGFSYVPGLNERFSALSPTQKRLVMLAMLTLVTGGVFALSCLDALIVLGGVACDRTGAWGLIRALVLAAIANQSTYALSPRVNGG